MLLKLSFLTKKILFSFLSTCVLISLFFLYFPSKENFLFKTSFKSSNYEFSLIGYGSKKNQRLLLNDINLLLDSLEDSFYKPYSKWYQFNFESEQPDPLFFDFISQISSLKPVPLKSSCLDKLNFNYCFNQINQFYALDVREQSLKKLNPSNPVLSVSKDPFLLQAYTLTLVEKILAKNNIKSFVLKLNSFFMSHEMPKDVFNTLNLPASLSSLKEYYFSDKTIFVNKNNLIIFPTTNNSTFLQTAVVLFPVFKENEDINSINFESYELPKPIIIKSR